MNYKIRKFLFIHLSRFILFAHLTSIMPEIKGVKHSAKTATSCSKSEDLHDYPVEIVGTPNKINESFKERMEIFPRNQVI